MEIRIYSETDDTQLFDIMKEEGWVCSYEDTKFEVQVRE